MNPTEPNNQPRRPAGRVVAVAAVALALATLLSVAVAPPAGAARFTGRLTSAQLAAKNAVNRERKLNGRAVLVSEADAQAKAQAWANRLAAEGRIYHSRLSDGIRTRWCSLGENVGYGPTQASIQKAFMGSARHRANILNPKFTGVGVGVAYRGNVVYVVQFFIKPC